MAHGITNKDSMMSVRQVPWHGLGTVLDDYPGSIQEAITASGLGWQVVPTPIYIPQINLTDEGVEQTFVEVPNAKANVRDDTNDVLGVVTNKYTIIQNSEAFEFLDALIGSELHFETAGSLWGGKTTWVLVKLPDFVEVGGDPCAQFAFVTNTHDGTGAMKAAVTPVRIVCNNTLSWALNAVKRAISIRHMGEDLNAKMYEARRVLELTVDYNARFKELGDELAQVKMTKPQFEKIVAELVPLDEDSMSKRSITMAGNARTKLIDIYNGKGEDGDTRGNAPGTKWCAVNAIAEYADWGRKMTSRGNQVARSFEDNSLKQQGLDLILAA